MHNSGKPGHSGRFFGPRRIQREVHPTHSDLLTETPAHTRAALEEDIERAGYYPTVVMDVLNDSLLAEEVESFLVHPETHLDMERIVRHITVLVLTGTRLIAIHVGDQAIPGQERETVAQASSEAIRIPRVASVTTRYLYPNADVHQSGASPHELIIALSWGSSTRTEIGAAACGDPECTAEHGYMAESTQEDLVIRISSEADGSQAVEQAQDFVRRLRIAMAGLQHDSIIGHAQMSVAAAE